jgi:putative hemolysin
MDLISFSRIEKMGLKFPKNPILKSFLFRYLKVRRMNRLYKAHLVGHQGIRFIEKLMGAMNIHFEIPPEELKNIPEKGPFLVISNHPYGFLDGVALINLVGRQRNDFKVLANYFLSEFEPIRDYFIPLNPFEGKNRMNVNGLRVALTHLRDGKPLGLFPAGEVATMQKGFGKIEDKEWDPAVIRFIKSAGVPVIPVYFFGSNSFIFHLLGKIHPYLRTLTIPSEFFKKQNKNIRLRVGKPVMPEELNEFADNEKAGRYLRTCLYALGRYGHTKKFWRVNLQLPKRPEAIVDPVPIDEIERELCRLKENGGLLFSKSNYEIYLGDADHIPGILREIGRLREVTFRMVGEGTNKKLDLDNYDLYYSHLFVFDRSNNVIIGAYRLGKGDEIIDENGVSGFYVSSLFELDAQFIPILRQTLELGRSFVVKEYQQKPLPLFLLWQGILYFLRNNPHYQYLMGPVSISNDFSGFSKDLLIAFIKKNYYNPELAKWVYPKKEFKVKSDPQDIYVVLENHSNDLQKLDKFISGIEPNYLKIPVLLKQYLKQNARIIGFNVDPDFNDCLDGLMILDLKDVPEETFVFLNRK